MNCPKCNEELIKIAQTEEYRCCKYGCAKPLMYPTYLTEPWWSVSYKPDGNCWMIDGVQYTDKQVDSFRKLKAFW